MLFGLCLSLLPVSLPAQGPLIYGYLTSYPSQSNATSQATIAWLNKYHINYVQFYDWQWRHHIPLAGTVSNPASSWNDIAGPTNYRQTILDLIAACHSNGMKAMNYNLIYGAWAGYNADGSGVDPQWGLFNDNNGCGGAQWSFTAFTNVFLFNPANAAWQNYIFSRENDAFAVYPFDGWQVDQIGDGSFKYDCAGNIIDVAQTFAGFLNNAKAATGKRIIFNNVGGYGLFYAANQTSNDAVYVECWPGPQPTYNDLKQVIDDALAWGNGKPVVVAAYMNYSKTNGSFRTQSVLLTDAAIFASGATHIELGDGGYMLCSEYFPNHRLSLSTTLANTLTNYYNFIVTYKDWLYGGMTNTANVISLSIPSAGIATANRVWAFAKIKNVAHLLNLINLTGETSINWRDDYGNYPTPAAQSNFTVKYYYGAGNISSVQLASPDINGGAPDNRTFTTGSDAGGNYVTFTVPSLAYWDTIMICGEVAAVPTGLTATPVGNQIDLNWMQSTGAASYNVSRAGNSGGPYSTIATGLTGTSYTDTNVVVGSTYYYVVSATNACSASANSTEAGAAANNAFAVNSGGSAAANFIADAFVVGGAVATPSTATIATAGLTNPAPQAVYQTERYGNFTYTFTGLNPGSNYTARLHFAECHWTAVGQRRFNVSINGTQVLTDFDIIAVTGGQNIATIREFPAVPDPTGQIVIAYTTITDNAKSSGIEILASTNIGPTVPKELTGVKLENGNLTLTWTSPTNYLGILQHASDLAGTWTDIYTNASPTGITNTVTIPEPVESPAFYRVKLLGP